MSKRREEWADIFQALGTSVFEVLRSEWALLRQQWWHRSARRAAYAAIFFFAAACFFFVLVGLAVAASVLMVEHFFELALWQAALWVTLAVLLVTIGLAAIGQLVFVRRFENPAAAARERLGDHMEWWRERLLRDAGNALLEGDGDGES